MMNTLQYDLNRWSSQRWIRNTRFYDMHIHQDLWGDWIATRVNGRLSSALGRVVHTNASSREHAMTIRTQWQKKRKGRGYTPIFGESGNG